MAVVRSLVAALGTIVIKYKKKGFRRYLLPSKKIMSLAIVPPASVRGMEILDRTKFTVSQDVPVLLIGNTNIAKVMSAIKKYILKMQKFKPVQDDPDGNGKIAFLDPKKIQEFKDFDEIDRKILIDNNVNMVKTLPTTFTYDNWRYDEIFKAVFNEGDEVPNAYSKVGHILHLNLRDSHLHRKRLIGEVLLDKISHARTVVNKLNTIDTTYRHFAMEIIAGENDTLATVNENGCKYKFDFATVYWNTRLSTEHQNLVSLLKKNDVLYDVFAGVGPFVIPAAVKGNKVLANDLNPESFRWLKENAKMNKTKDNIKAFNKDGRDFLQHEVKEDIIRRRKLKLQGLEHIAMNLPAMAIEFLDVFPGWFDSNEAESLMEKPPIIHLYCFIKLGREEDAFKMAKVAVEDKLGCLLNSDSLVTIHHVRNVSPNKEMMRVSFRLTRDIILSKEEEQPEKMGKNKATASHHKTKNVFKVAGARSLKLKAKAQKVSTELKKLNLKPEKKSAPTSTKGKTADIDKQLVELRKEVSQSKPQKIAKKPPQQKQQKQMNKNDNASRRMATRAQTEAAANLVEGMQI